MKPRQTWAAILAGRPLSVQPRGGEAKPYQVAQFVAMVEEFGLSLEGDE